jgi:hypothetical protein
MLKGVYTIKTATVRSTSAKMGSIGMSIIVRAGGGIVRLGRVIE